MLARFAAVLAVLLLAVSPAFAAVKDAVKNKEGYWSVDAEGDACYAGMTLQGGAQLSFRGIRGDVSLALFSETALPKGKTLSLQADDHAIDLSATVFPDLTGVFIDGNLDAPSLARVREARQLRLLMGGRPIATMTLEGTGLSDVLDSLVACSNGKVGWWGKGVAVEGAAPSAAPAEPVKYAYNPEDAWMIVPLENVGSCLAQAATDDEDRVLQFLQQGADITIAITSPGATLPRGRKGELVLDAGTFNFKPDYDGKALIVMDGALTDEALNLLKTTKAFALRVDGKVLVDGDLDGSGFPKILDELAACSRGETGWWTANAAVKSAR